MIGVLRMDDLQVLDSTKLSSWKMCVLRLFINGIIVVSYWQEGSQLIDIFLKVEDLKVTLYCIEV